MTTAATAPPPRGSLRRRRFTTAQIKAAREHCPAATHGTAHAYNSRPPCRCPDAREDHRLRQLTAARATADNYLVDVTGTCRRARALVAIGWPMVTQAAQLGLSRDAVSLWLRRPTGQLQRYTAERMTQLYRQLKRTPGPSIHRAIATARREGYSPPAAWQRLDIDNPKVQPWHYSWDTDWVVVDRVIAAARGAYTGPLPDLSPDDAAAAVHKIMARFTLPAAALVRVFTMDRAFSQYLTKRGGVTTKQLTGDRTATNFHPRPHALPIPPQIIEQGLEAMAA